MNILVSGGTGFIGQALVQSLLDKGHHVWLLVRNTSKPSSVSHTHLNTLLWDGMSPGAWGSAIEHADAVINLAGASVADRRWTTSRKETILKSRTRTTAALVQAINAASHKPSVFINASAVGFYGHVPYGDVTEQSEKGTGFLADVCDRWEREAQKVARDTTRVISLRLGVVLENNGGALSKMLIPFKLFMGGPLGSGTQWFPWIHRRDVIQIIHTLLNTPSLSGPINACAPQSLTVKDFCSTLGRVLHRPSWLPVPGFMMRLLLGQMAEEMLLSGQKVRPQKLLDAGFSFTYPDAESALKDILTS